MNLTPTVLCPFEVGDSGFFTFLASNEQVTRFIGDGRPWDHQRIKARLQEALSQDTLDKVGATRWFLAAEEREPVGIVVCTYREEGIEIGYWVSPDRWGRGLAGAMLDAALKTLRGMRGNLNVLAKVSPANVAPARAVMRRGFQLISREAGLDCYVHGRQAAASGRDAGMQV